MYSGVAVGECKRRRSLVVADHVGQKHVDYVTIELHRAYAHNEYSNEAHGVGQGPHATLVASPKTVQEVSMKQIKFVSVPARDQDAALEFLDDENRLARRHRPAHGTRPALDRAEDPRCADWYRAIYPARSRSSHWNVLGRVLRRLGRRGDLRASQRRWRRVRAATEEGELGHVAAVFKDPDGSSFVLSSIVNEAAAGARGRKLLRAAFERDRERRGRWCGPGRIVMRDGDDSGSGADCSKLVELRRAAWILCARKRHPLETHGRR